MKAMNKSAILFTALTLALPVGSAFVGNAVISQLKQSPTVYIAETASTAINFMQSDENNQDAAKAAVLPLLK